MPGFLITSILGVGIFLLHAVAGEPSLRALAVCDLIAALGMLTALLAASTRREAAFPALRLGPAAIAALGLGYLIHARTEADWAGLSSVLAAAMGPILAAITAYSVARGSDRHGVLRGLYLAGGVGALWSSLSFLAVSSGAAPSALALPLDFTTHPAASLIFASAFTAASFALGEEAARAPRRGEPRLAPLAQRLLLPLAVCACCLTALRLSGALAPILAAGLGASGVAIGLALRARRLAGPAWAALPAVTAFLLMGLGLLAGEAPPWAGAWRSAFAVVLWLPMLALLIGACVLAKDRKRAPTRGLALLLGNGAVLITLAAFSASWQSPSGLLVCAMLLGLALSYRDAEAKPARRQNVLGASRSAKSS